MLSKGSLQITLSGASYWSTRKFIATQQNCLAKQYIIGKQRLASPSMNFSHAQSNFFARKIGCLSLLGFSQVLMQSRYDYPGPRGFLSPRRSAKRRDTEGKKRRAENLVYFLSLHRFALRASLIALLALLLENLWLPGYLTTWKKLVGF